MFKKIIISMFLFGVIVANDKQKVILITGTAHGIGKSTAEYLIDKGHIIYGGDILVEENLYLNDIGGVALKMDVTKQEDVDNAINRVIAEQGRIDVLVNNAGIAVGSAIEDVSMEDAMYQFEVNLFGIGRTVKATLPHMRSQGSGTIINISSVLGKAYNPLYGWYVSSKHALEGWSDVLRLEVEQFGIDVVIIEPGMIKTNIGNYSARYFEKYSKNSEYENFYGSPDDKEENTFDSYSDPIVIAKVIDKAISAKNPKTRYSAGAYSWILLTMRGILPDKWFDNFIVKVTG
ncbi:MAG: oxidoreductase [Candidatus Neomarinimicrobiota bacterium]|nr:oxidoreductase [Candidatus Neomarinimicrobiota bacterium]